MRLIGITGTIGAGKGTIVEYLTTRHHFKHFSVREYLTRIINERGMPVNRDSLVAIGNELRAKNSPSFIAEELYREAKESGGDCIIESIRTVGEVNALHAKGNFHLFAVDADQRLRYDRIVVRASATDKIDYETFIENEIREMNSNDPNKQNLSECIKLSDYQFINNGSLESLYKQIDEVLLKLKG